MRTDRTKRRAKRDGSLRTEVGWWYRRRLACFQATFLGWGTIRGLGIISLTIAGPAPQTSLKLNVAKDLWLHTTLAPISTVVNKYHQRINEEYHSQGEAWAKMYQERHVRWSHKSTNHWWLGLPCLLELFSLLF